MEEKTKKPIYKRWWFVLIVVVVVIGAIGSRGEKDTNELETDNKASIEQSDTNEPVNTDETEEESKEEEPEESSKSVQEDIPKEYQSALKKSDAYANMYMSKAGLYNQLVSEYGEGFSEEAAQYAIDNVEADWKENALQKAIIYQDDMAMSPNAIRDQLTSEHGEQFTEEEASYAIDNLPK